jgi:hypothetical protein
MYVHLDEVGQGPRAHLFHHPGAVNFHGALTHAEFVRNYLVRLAGYDEVEDFALPIR